MYSCVSLLLLTGNLSREHMIRITIVRLVGKVHFRSDYDILGHDKASFPIIRFIRVGYVIVKDFCQVSRAGEGISEPLSAILYNMLSDELFKHPATQIESLVLSCR